MIITVPIEVPGANPSVSTADELVVSADTLDDARRQLLELARVHGDVRLSPTVEPVGCTPEEVGFPDLDWFVPYGWEEDGTEA